ncbi:PREDICTED: RWD domain-containing protein 2A [Bactrocera latifrons]|uniref:RWD domain-containing protein 2A n=1 Tax=Bactrocera latifrons TaxID=174628 RepID=A0A0K8WLT8_BACLA|nr:PREDICTED: RWD domain-containing protein 2A [Bactrocera latifrons]XP_018784494.1 PREDICTED: RWD domain-containing protein 2A [Bactrocera latifrons]
MDAVQPTLQLDQLNEHELYVQCITKQLEEVDLLSSIYCTPGEMHILDASVISDFHDFLKTPIVVPTNVLKAHLDYIITVSVLHGKSKEKVDIRIELPNLYPLLENAIVTIFSTLLGKAKEQHLKREIEKYINTMDKSECYVFQVVSWLQDELNDLISRDGSEFEVKKQAAADENETALECERLWIYSHHIKSKKKRQEIQRVARNMDLSGFLRPGKPGIICVEGVRAHTQEFWRVIKAMHWQHITICKSELWQGKLEQRRRFDGFKEQLFCDDLDNEEGVMNMALFIKYLETHKSGYMKKELFGLE